MKSVRADYSTVLNPKPAPELPGGVTPSVAHIAVRELLRRCGFDSAAYGTERWNPLGDLIRPGSRVVLKPNWVLHYNKSGEGMNCLVTHTSVVEAVLDYVDLARPGLVTVGDAPVQGCDFAALRDGCGLDHMAERFRRRGLPLAVTDFRRTVRPGETHERPQVENVRDAGHFVLFDIGSHSLLEPLAQDAAKFRVTMYNPDLLLRTHALGRHQYLIAREVIDADVVINLPKLKCHKKAGVTGALKNLVGINGNKEFLPHHRKGGSQAGGDCYEGASRFKQYAETLLDMANRSSVALVQRTTARAAGAALSCAQRFGADGNLEGSWYGNDTVWRMCLDLQRILKYGTTAGTLTKTPQRRVLTITDAIVAGEGEGPLAPTPIAAGFMTAGMSPAATEWVNAVLMGLDPRRIPLVRNAFLPFSFPLVDFRPEDLRVISDQGERRADELISPAPRAFRPPKGWVGRCELRDPRHAEPDLVA
ncbi:MAG: DUF362 domain-containing protein [Acidobacteria bacterium]|nr:DUF362 domain-containing protein [Acidobacteriota bacterium]